MSRGDRVRHHIVGASEEPHSAQNLAPEPKAWPQRGQLPGNAVPHSSQNFAAAPFSCWQREHGNATAAVAMPYPSSSSSAFAWMRSRVSKPSVNQA